MYPFILARGGLAVGLMVSLALITSCQLLNRASAAQGIQGRIAWPKDGDLWVYDIGSKQQTKITNLASGAAVTGATWSPDGQRVIFAQFWRRPNERSSGADLMVANADGSDAHPFAERDAANSVLETPEWMPSGAVYYTVRTVTNGRETQAIVRRQTDSAQPEMVIDNAYDPAVSPDESTLVYVRSTRAGQTMFKKTIGEAGDGCELISDQVFQYLSLPRISPDGKRLAFGGSGEAEPAAEWLRRRPAEQAERRGAASPRPGGGLARARCRVRARVARGRLLDQSGRRRDDAPRRHQGRRSDGGLVAGRREARHLRGRRALRGRRQRRARPTSSSTRAGTGGLDWSR